MIAQSARNPRANHRRERIVMGRQCVRRASCVTPCMKGSDARNRRGRCTLTGSWIRALGGKAKWWRDHFQDFLQSTYSYHYTAILFGRGVVARNYFCNLNPYPTSTNDTGRKRGKVRLFDRLPSSDPHEGPIAWDSYPTNEKHPPSTCLNPSAQRYYAKLGSEVQVPAEFHSDAPPLGSRSTALRTPLDLASKTCPHM